jgi:hypothetical protein
MRSQRRFHHILARTSTWINKTAGTQFLPRFEVKRATFALNIGRKFTARIRSFLPRQPKPSQVFYNRSTKFRPATRQIEIFNSQNQFSTGRPGAFLCAPKRHGMP